MLTRINILLCLLASVASADERDPDTALYLSGIGAVVGAGLMIPAGNSTSTEWKTAVPLLVGAELVPSIGHVYAGHYVSPGLITRFVGGGLLVLAFNDPFPKHPQSNDPFSPLGGLSLVLGLGLSIGGAVHDIVTARAATRRYNARHVMVTPTAFSTPAGTVTGVAFGGAF